MGSGVLTRYNASAGSGKTYKLTSIYLSKLFSSKNSYKKILAVTFTNKAAAEMKRKILSQLYALSKGEDSDLIDKLSEASGRTPEEIVSGARPILHTILHDYSSFNVGTIDSFFQKVLKAFTREIGLQHGYVIELDHSIILRHAVDAMFAATAEDSALREWITEYSHERTEGGKSWNIREDILKLAEEIFREKFRLIPQEERDKLKDKTFLIAYTKELKKLQSDFGRRLNDYSKRCRELLEKHNVTDDMFLRGEKGGVPSFLNMAGADNNGPWKPLTATINQVLETPPVWTSKLGPSPQLRTALADGFGSLCMEAVSYYNENFFSANTALFIADNIYILGILANVLEQVHIITSSENRFLLSDAGELLWLIIKDDQTPFIYEKTGNRFENFMIDEFQDTSHIQWNNFRPLIENSMAEGNDNLVVGDVKQSIYRWRNSDWRILKSTLNEQIRASGLKDEFLDQNWRSSSNIISFNNTLFSILPRLIDRSEKNNTGSYILEDLYKNSVQKSPGKKEGGMVRIEFLDNGEMSFQENALSRLPAIIEELQDKGYSGSDIGILVRTNREGASVLNRILEYRESADEGKRKKYNYNIISSESLLLSAAPSVGFIISILKSLYEDNNRLSMSLMIRNWLLLSGYDPFSADLTDVTGEADRLFPNGFRELIDQIRRMTLFESVEAIIRFFKLGEKHGNTAYLNSLQDCVLEFSGNFSTDIPSFLEWWENTGIKKSVVVSDQPDSMRVITIHKSKGLEFRVVIIPFISWNTGHGSSGPTLWVNPEGEPFNKLGIVPVRYKADLQYSGFSEDYFNETYYTLVDNINLLYVAFTRAVDRIYGFCPLKSKSGTISKVLYDALLTETEYLPPEEKINLRQYFDTGRNLFGFGESVKSEDIQSNQGTGRITSMGYYVNNGINRLHLRFHGENWLGKASEERKSRINYGTLMHEILESVLTPDDVDDAIKKMLIEGRITLAQKGEIESRIKEALGKPEVKGWFASGLKVMNETSILSPDGTTRRPDRVIITDEKVIIIDFKFGSEKEDYRKQLNEYRKLIESIENKPGEAFIWYVDNNKIIRV